MSPALLLAADAIAASAVAASGSYVSGSCCVTAAADSSVVPPDEADLGSFCCGRWRGMAVGAMGMGIH